MDGGANSTFEHTADASPQGLLTEGQYFLTLQAFAVISAVVGVFGIAGNVINIRTFYVLGLKDGVSIGFFALSIADLFYLFLFLVKRVSTALANMEYESLFWLPVDPYVFAFFTANTIYITSLSGMFIVTFLAVVRCLCVTMPLHFKSVFTKFRCTAFMIGFAVLAVSIYTPILANMGVQQRFDPNHNASRVVMWFSDEREQIKDTVWLVFDVTLPVVVEIVLITCAVLMTFALRRSAKFRQPGGPRTDQGHDVSDETKLSSRDLRVVHQVILISVIYVVANMPKVFNSLYTQIQPEYDVNRRFHYFYLMVSDLRMVFDCFNAAVNIFVYYKFNSAFRAACFAFRKGQKR